ncbi:hypothetical protein SUGI_0174330 [Cryptomeria japonica]|nr:hypothetical protein SUGI_0174330 [Cryptomeria japonica]
MMPYNHIVRDVFLVLLTMTAIGIALSGILHKATATFNPFLPAITAPVSASTQPLGELGKIPAKTGNSSKEIKVTAPASVTVQPLDELGKILAKTANANRTLIVTALNWAWAEPSTMIDLFLKSFLIGEGTEELLQNLLIVALDAKAYNRCLEIHPHCYSLKTRGVDFSGEKTYMSDDYLKMMWTRLAFLGDVLRRGYNIIFSDTDIVWLRNPIGRLQADADIQITCDNYNGDPFSVKNEANTGYMYIHSNELTISFYRHWYLSRRMFPEMKEQDVFNILKFSAGFRRKGMKFVFLDTKYFGGFCERSNDLKDAYTMHANCCRGLKAKLVDLRYTLEDWSHYKNLPLNETGTSIRWRLPNACRNSWFL